MLPQDPMMLLSFLNMKLRDDYSSLSALCEDMDADEAEIIAKMKDAGFTYNPANNQFK